MISKKKLTALACSAALASVVAQDTQMFVDIAGENYTSITAKAQEAAANPIVLSVKNMNVVRRDPGNTATGDYTPSDTSVIYSFSENAKIGDTFEMKLMAVNDKNESKPLFKGLTPSEQPLDLVNEEGEVIGQYQVVSEDGLTSVTLNDKFKPNQSVRLNYSGQTINPHSDGNAKGFSYIRVDAKLNGVNISSTTFQMAIKPDNVEWETHSAEHIEWVSDEVIPFETETRENPDMLVGQEKVVQEGVDGVKRTTKKQKIVDGKPVGEPELETVVAKTPIKRIVEIGTGVETEVPYKIEYKSDETLPFSHQYVVSRGQFGKSVNGKITIQPVNEIVHVGTMREEKSTIEFNTKTVENPDMHAGTERVVQEGVNGEVIHKHRYELDPNTGKLSETYTTEDITVVEMVPKIIEVGIGVDGTIPYDIVRIPNLSLKPGEEKVIQDGVLGEKWNDTITKKPIEMIIEYGPRLNNRVPFEVERIPNDSLKPGEEKVIQEGVEGVMENGELKEKPINKIVEHGPEIQPEEIPFKTIRRANVKLAPGTEEVVVKGVKGVLDNGNVIKTPIDEIIEYGPKEIPFEKTSTLDFTKDPGYSEVVQVGVPGLIDEDGNVLREPIHEVTKIGAKGSGTEVQPEHNNKPIPFETKRVVNPDLKPGEERVVQEGINGEMSEDGTVIKEPVVEIIEYGEETTEEITEETTEEMTEETTEETKEEITEETTEDSSEKPDGNFIELTPTPQQSSEVDIPDHAEDAAGEVDENQASEDNAKPSNNEEVISSGLDNAPAQDNNIIPPALQEVEAYESRQVNTNPESTTNTQSNTNGTTSPDVKADVKTGVENIAGNPVLFGTLATAIAGVLSAIGIKFKRDKKDK